MIMLSRLGAAPHVGTMPVSPQCRLMRTRTLQQQICVRTRLPAAPAASCEQDSRSEPPQWPRVAQPDATKSEHAEKQWEAAICSDIDEAQLAKNRETFLLRLASLGFGAVLVGERVSGKGVVQALGHPTGVSLYEMDLGLGVLIGALLIGGLAPTRFIYRSVQDDPRSIFSEVPALLGRLSCLGLAGTIVAEVFTGKGILGLLNFETGKEALTELEFGGIFLLLLLVTNLKPSSNEDK